MRSSWVSAEKPRGDRSRLTLALSGIAGGEWIEHESVSLFGTLGLLVCIRGVLRAPGSCKMRKGNWVAPALFVAGGLGDLDDEEQLSHLSALYRRMAARRGATRAVMAVADALLAISFQMRKRKENSLELGADPFDRIDDSRVRRSLVRQLGTSGTRVTR
jgi:hypothetical protein